MFERLKIRNWFFNKIVEDIFWWRFGKYKFPRSKITYNTIKTRKKEIILVLKMNMLLAYRQYFEKTRRNVTVLLNKKIKQSIVYVVFSR